MVLELKDISKDFGEFKLHPLNLTIQPGEFFSLLGPSGCGKTTVLRMIGGFESPTRGKILLGGRDITHQPAHLRSVHTVFQRYALFPHLNVYDNVGFPLRLQRASSREIKEKVGRALELVEISNLASRKIHQLSGGQSQRVALARALVDQPPVLLLDEPLSALDPSLRIRVREELKALCRKVGSTFVFVTHDQEEALLLSDRMAVMKGGYCLQVGTPKDIYEYPADPFIARFIGPTNEIAGELEEDGAESWVIRSGLGNFRLKRNGSTLPKAVTVILRPEKMRLLRSRSNVQENLVEGTISDLSYLGSRTEYTFRPNGGAQSFRVFEPELERQKKRSLNPGDKAYVGWKAEDAILLPQTDAGVSGEL